MAILTAIGCLVHWRLPVRASDRL